MLTYPHRGMFSRSAEKISHNLTGTGGTNDGRKRQRSESLSSDEGIDGPCMKSRKDSDAIRVTASEEEVQNLLGGFNGGARTKTSLMRIPKTTMKF